ncbi:hypothetical protein Dacet_0793 [Denitrovibrio acetiphilus DSM 12809]|uniref:Alginate export domain-containing protein n=1 Tax=Denitrovibrio acetiphilus (strain DSM 12809 / NBRC 114555 / N2460) TaxID=522772 RepID=D4H5F3_DENA2|nr:hypothetical protein [Denitrovibrio acetiphilus]ADD67573.1 hypothetical protein Dacet_0793 [Denitrovibrio acetiphilus DSM 12809]
MKVFRLVFVVMLLYISSASAFSLDGSLSTLYEVSKDKGEDSEGLWENYLSIDNAKILDPYVGVNFYGRYAYDTEADDDYTDIYSAYLDYSSFQDTFQAKVGRFLYVGNRFLTLNGAQVTVRTDYLFGATVFAGKPEFFDADGKHVNEKYRYTGDRFYGGRIFLNGVKNTSGFISYTRETDGGDTLQELLGVGAGHRLDISEDFFIKADGRVEYDTEENVIYKSIARVSVDYKKLRLLGDITTYDVEDGTSYEDELIISNFSTGKQERYAFTVQYALTPNITPYQSTVFSRIELPAGLVENGEIYKLGVDLNYFKEVGVNANLEGYYYNSLISNAKGGSFIIDWSLNKKTRLSFEAEVLRLENSKGEDNVYSLYVEAVYDVLKDITVTAYAENNQETRYLPENRYGLKATYSF